MDKVIVIFPKFPSKSEVFAANELRFLNLNSDMDIKILSMKRNSQADNELLKAFGYATKDVLYPSLPRDWYSICQVISAAGRAVKHIIQRPSLLQGGPFRHFASILVSACMVPLLAHHRPSSLHLYWGHYPAWLFLCLPRASQYKKSLFLGAYDLAKNLNISMYVATQPDVSVVTHSVYGQSILIEKKIPSSSICQIYRGIEVESLVLRGTKWPTRPRMFVSAGRLIKEKRFLDLIDYLGQYYPDKTMALFGEGSEKNNLNQRIAYWNMRATIQGYVFRPFLVSEFEESKFFIFFSNKDGEILPNVVKEAMYAGCVVICRRIPAIEELITDKVDGFIFDQIEDIQKIIALDESSLSRVSISAHKKIVMNFTLGTTAAAYKKLWCK